MTFPVGAPYPLPEEHPMFDFPLITEHTVMRCLRRLPPSKSSGCSVLSHRVLRLRVLSHRVLSHRVLRLRLSHLPLQPVNQDGHLPQRLEDCGCYPYFQESGKNRKPIQL